ncbi:MAG TPA: 3-hydroxyacyl-ACP dehydratase FabZ family protein [Verrucomicrobiae bacterium]|nr:3-hydroxyacyl-ACP dehydratase FabZ family protein [Verrucomicrobiae bacterium]
MRFILVDEILELVPGRRVRACKRIAPDEDYFADHFPGFPVVPGVLLTEMMGQAAAKCLLVEPGERGRPMLAQIKSASFRDWVRPGQTVTLLAEVRANRPQFATVACQAEVEGRPVAAAELLFSFVAADQFDPHYRDAVLDAYLAKQPCAGTPPPDNRAAAK